VRLNLTPSLAKEQCSSRDAKGVKICITPGTPTNAQPPGPAAPHVGPLTTQPLPADLCAPTGRATVRVTRTASCTSLPMSIQITRTTNTGTTVIGTNQIVTYLYQYSSLDLTTMANQLTILPTSFTGTGNQSYVSSAVPACKGSCKLGSNGPSITGRKLTPKSEISTESFYTWTGTKARTDQTMNWKITFAHPTATGTPSVDAAPGINYRCDREAANAKAGCVVKQSSMQIVYAKTGWPNFGRHVSLAQGSGLPGASKPLTRLDANQSSTANRNKACPSNLPRPSGKDCDEYPFASTKQGAALNGGTGRTFANCGINDKRYTIGAKGATGFSACMIPSKENQDAGSQMGVFFGKYHVLSGDNFYVAIS